jgi:tetrapyrrole methylase family protein/MazG family protein
MTTSILWEKEVIMPENHENHEKFDENPNRKPGSSGQAPGETGVGGGFAAFVGTIERLRSPKGCPWDREQTHRSIARNLIEEAYEAVDAIERDDMSDLREELGDVLLQVVLQSQIASEAGAFCIADVVADVNEKMIRRHPHVFGDERAFAAAHLSDEQIARIKATTTPGEVLSLWDQIKLVEKRDKAAAAAGATSAAATGGAAAAAGAAAATGGAAAAGQTADLLRSIPTSLPALMQAQDISRKAVSVGFEWPDVASVWEQVAAEMEEYRAEPPGSAAAAGEFGDVLFSLVNVARKEGIDAESALRLTCHKFRARWAIMERNIQAAGKHLSDCSLDELEGLWRQAKEATQ